MEFENSPVFPMRARLKRVFKICQINTAKMLIFRTKFVRTRGLSEHGDKCAAQKPLEIVHDQHVSRQRHLHHLSYTPAFHLKAQSDKCLMNQLLATTATKNVPQQRLERGLSSLKFFHCGFKTTRYQCCWSSFFFFFLNSV